MYVGPEVVYQIDLVGTNQRIKTADAVVANLVFERGICRGMTLGKCRRCRTARRNRALRLSMALVV
jgi:hypothetical protein